MPEINDARERIASYVTVTPSGCWEWAGGKTPKGYGRMRANGKVTYSHRYAYEIFVGPIPPGLQIDHLCRNRSCCNPEHLEPVTAAENLHRSSLTMASRNVRKTHCPQLHPYDDVNTYIYSDGSRACRECRRARGRANYQRRILAAANVAERAA